MPRAQFTLKTLLWLMAVVACFLALTVHGTILRARFSLSRSAINSVATAVDRGHYPQTPCWVGLFWVREIRVKLGQVMLLTDPPDRTGLVRGDKPTKNVWSVCRLDKDWWYTVED